MLEIDTQQATLLAASAFSRVSPARAIQAAARIIADQLLQDPNALKQALTDPNAHPLLKAGACHYWLTRNALGEDLEGVTESDVINAIASCERAHQIALATMHHIPEQSARQIADSLLANKQEKDAIAFIALVFNHKPDIQAEYFVQLSKQGKASTIGRWHPMSVPEDKRVQYFTSASPMYAIYLGKVWNIPLNVRRAKLESLRGDYRYMALADWGFPPSVVLEHSKNLSPSHFAALLKRVSSLSVKDRFNILEKHFSNSKNHYREALLAWDDAPLTERLAIAEQKEMPDVAAAIRALNAKDDDEFIYHLLAINDGDLARRTLNAYTNGDPDHPVVQALAERASPKFIKKIAMSFAQQRMSTGTKLSYITNYHLTDVSIPIGERLKRLGQEYRALVNEAIASIPDLFSKVRLAKTVEQRLVQMSWARVAGAKMASLLGTGVLNAEQEYLALRRMHPLQALIVGTLKPVRGAALNRYFAENTNPMFRLMAGLLWPPSFYRSTRSLPALLGTAVALSVFPVGLVHRIAIKAFRAVREVVREVKAASDGRFEHVLDEIERAHQTGSYAKKYPGLQAPLRRSALAPATTAPQGQADDDQSQQAPPSWLKPMTLPAAQGSAAQTRSNTP